MSLTVHKVVIHQTVADMIKEHSQKEKEKGNYEAVGFVAVSIDEETATATVPLHNHSSHPTEAFFVEPWEQFQAERKIGMGGYRIVGVYHSHVNSEALPSMQDHKLAWGEGYIVFIYSVIYDDLKAYHKVGDFLEPTELEIEYA